LVKTHPPVTFSLINSLKASLEGAVDNFDSVRLVVAVSGGIDSIVLLNLLVRITNPSNLTVAHFDHNLREDSARDAEFVKQFSDKLGVNVNIGRAVDYPEGENLESWARNRRYTFLESARESTNSDWILTAHNQNDQVETILMRVISGRVATKSFGIAKIDSSRKLLRPLLNVTRKEIESCVKELELDFREDSTNAVLDRTRNKIRHQLIPLLVSDFNPRLLDTIGQVSSRLALDESYLWQEASKSDLLRQWSAEAFLELPFALQWRILDGQVAQSGSKRPSGKTPEEVAVHREVGFRALKLATERIIQGYRDTFLLDLGACIRMSYSYNKGPRFEFYQHRKPSQGRVL